MSKLRSAVIGCGIISASHLDVLKNQGHSPVALCDVDEEKAKAQAEKYCPEAAIYTDYITMLDEVKPDVVHVLTPHYLHSQMIVEILKRDIHCLCEKPVCIREDEFEAIAKAEQTSKGMLGVCFQHRFMATNRYVKSRMEEETPVGMAAFVAWHRDESYYGSAPWRGKMETEGGALLINQAIHTLDQMVWMLGKPVAVTANLSNRTLQGVIEAEDTAELFIEFENGTTAQLYATNGAADNFTVEIKAKTDAARYDFNSNQVYRNKKPVEMEVGNASVDAKSYWGNGHYYLIREFYRCMEAGEKFPVDFAAASVAVRVILASYKSGGKRVEI